MKVAHKGRANPLALKKKNKTSRIPRDEVTAGNSFQSVIVVVVEVVVVVKCTPLEKRNCRRCNDVGC